MNGVLVERKRMLYIETVEPMYDKPEMLYLYWPTGQGAHYYQGCNVIGLTGQLRHDYFLDENGVAWYLENGARTTGDPELTHTEPIPPPRGKQVRYERGHWERFTKARGWEIAG